MIEFINSPPVLEFFTAIGFLTVIGAYSALGMCALYKRGDPILDNIYCTTWVDLLLMLVFLPITIMTVLILIILKFIFWLQDPIIKKSK